jgi:hypothetical protein
MIRHSLKSNIESKKSLNQPTGLLEDSRLFYYDYLQHLLIMLFGGSRPAGSGLLPGVFMNL